MSAAPELFHPVSCGCLPVAAALLAGRRWLFYALLPVLAFAPVTFDIFRQLLSDPLAAALSNTVVAAAILSAASRRRSVVHSILLALILGFWSITRPESPFMFSYLAAILVFLVARAIVADYGWRRLLRETALTCLLPGLSILAFESGVRTANRAAFGIAGIDVQHGDALTRAYDSLLQIDAGAGHRYIPVDRQVRALAYQVSPTFAALEPSLESTDSPHRELTRRFYGVDDIATIWFQFAWLAAIRATYPHASAVDREALFNRIADEVETALARHKLPQRRILVSWLDPRWRIWLPHLPESLLRVARGTFLPRARRLPEDDCDGFDAKAADFDFIANRRPSLVGCRGAPGAQRPIKNGYFNMIEGPLFLAIQGLSVAGLAAALLGAVALAWRAPRYPRTLPGLLTAFYLVSACILCRLLFYGLVDASLWPAEERFLLPTMPMASAASIIAIATVIEIAGSCIRNSSVRS